MNIHYKNEYKKTLGRGISYVKMQKSTKMSNIIYIYRDFNRNAYQVRFVVRQIHFAYRNLYKIKSNKFRSSYSNIISS